MRRALLIGALWLAATAATGAVAWGAVHLAGEPATEQAVRPMTARQVEALSTSPTTEPSPDTTLPTTATAPTSTTRPQTGPTSTTIPSPAGPTTTTTLPPSTTTAPAPTLAARQTAGGTVVVRVAGEEVWLVSATPAPGYAVEIEAGGPAQVLVRFDGANDSEVEVKVTASGGQAAFRVEQGGDGD